MGADSKIEWTDHTFNPWVGCTKVSPACDFCYAEGWSKRAGKSALWDAKVPPQRTSLANWYKPQKWQHDAEKFYAAHGRRQRVFCASLADVFDKQAHPVDRSDLFWLIDSTPDLDWLLLTKRPMLVTEQLDYIGRARLPENVWLGTTVENQTEADRRIPHLLATPAAKRFLSCEPLLGPVDLYGCSSDRKQIWNWLSGETGTMHFDGPDFDYGVKLDWVIVGGESGPNARPMHPDWARGLRDQCAAAGVPFFFKQWGEFAPGEIAGEFLNPNRAAKGLRLYCDGKWDDCWSEVDGHVDDEPDVYRVGKKRAGRLLDGVEHSGVPAWLRGLVRRGA